MIATHDPESGHPFVLHLDQSELLTVRLALEREAAKPSFESPYLVLARRMAEVIHGWGGD